MPDESATPLPPAAPPRGARSARALWPVALGLLGALVGIVGYATFADPAPTAEQADGGRRATPTSTTLGPASSVKVYRTILPSLVDIRTRRGGGEPGGLRGVGSGVVVSAEGLILTANHVVDGASAITVTFADGTEADAEIADADPANDIAVLQTGRFPEVVVPAVLGSSDGVEVGDEAYSAGSPLALAGSLTAGVISGLDRTIPLEGGVGELDGLIQFDAAVNPGSSGGPLLDRNGQVVGIVTALANPSGQNFFVGVGFAVPIETASGGAGGPNL
jgi:S1-C subfamily serine protease